MVLQAGDLGCLRDPRPQDPGSTRYTILAILSHFLVVAFNRLIEKGLPRGSKAIIRGREEEERLRARPVLLGGTAVGWRVWLGLRSLLLFRVGGQRAGGEGHRVSGLLGWMLVWLGRMCFLLSGITGA